MQGCLQIPESGPNGDLGKNVQRFHLDNPIESICCIEDFSLSQASPIKVLTLPANSQTYPVLAPPIAE